MSVPPLDPAHARLTSGYGLRFRGSDLHTGIDLAAVRGEPVRAVAAGIVVGSWPSGELSRYGQLVVIEHPSNVSRPVWSLYAHLDRRDVQRGDHVFEGQQIGTVGDTAGTHAEPGKRFGSSSTHLHFELLTQWPPSGKDQDRIDPTRLWPPSAAGGHIQPTTPPNDPQRRSIGGGALVALALAFAARGKEKRRQP